MDQDWQTRVRQERDALAEKCEKLKVYLMQGADIDALDLALLHQQYEAMSTYCEILDDRISRF